MMSMICNHGKKILLRDYAAYTASLEKQLGSTFIRKLNNSTVFAYRFMRELAEIMTMETALEPQEVRDKVRHYIILVFSGWGQTKICDQGTSIQGEDGHTQHETQPFSSVCFYA